MKQILFVCAFTTLVLCLATCNRDMSVDTPAKENGGFFTFRSNNQLEFSNHQISRNLVIENLEQKAIRVKIIGMADWLNIADSSGILPPGQTTWIFSVDTTKAIKTESPLHFTIETGDTTRTVYYNYFYIPPFPSHILDAANQFVISQVGEEFFNDNVEIDKHWCRFYPPLESCLDSPFNCAAYLLDYYYKLQYYIKSPNIPEPGGLIEIIMDTTGAIYYPRNGIEGLPDCIKNPGECQFPISEADALEIARNQLEGEITYSYVKFFWTSLYEQTYIWEVRCTVRVENSQSQSGFSSSNQIVVIDANSGVVLAINGWAVIP